MSTNVTFQGISNNSTFSQCVSNTESMNTQLASLQPGDTFLIPNTTYCMQGGVQAENLYDVVFQLDGTLSWTDEIDKWPRDSSNSVARSWQLTGLRNVTFTSSGAGTLFGNGQAWWGFISYLEIGENRPMLFHVQNSTHILMEHWYFEQSAYHTVELNDISDLEIRNCHINARRNDADRHSLWNLGAFNTDGFDVSGKNVYIHDVTVWNQDDWICVKAMNRRGINAQCTENWLVENVQASGLGLTIGSVGPNPDHNWVRNIVFRNCTMHNTYKGIYLKSAPGTGSGEITNILYEDITIISPEQWGFWMGPQQAIYHDQCSLFWPYIPGFHCPVTDLITWNNLTFRNVLIDSPSNSPGVILGNATNPMTNIVFDNVQAKNAWGIPWFGDYYKCDGVVNATAMGGTHPVPPCFTNNNQPQQMSCYSCGARGHMARDCTSGAVCFNCSQPGHNAKDCTEASMCHNCKSTEHLSYDCPMPKPDRQPKSDSCYECGEVGHFASRCPQRQSNEKCYNCNEIGHRQYECPLKPGNDSKSCYSCGKTGHIARNCPEAQ